MVRIEVKMHVIITGGIHRFRSRFITQTIREATMLRLIIALATVGTVWGKVYEACELASELRDRYQTPPEQIATWVCIAYQESRYNTEAVNTQNGDGSNDFGIFQINNRYWCSPPGTGCSLPCSSLLDDDIADDVRCSQTVYRETASRGEDGFSAWTTYPRCNNGQADSYIANCA